jgi:hypothetical protein
MPTPQAIKTLLDQGPGLWQGRRPNHGQPTLPSGHAELDARLPGHGWPLGAVTELIAQQPGLGEFRLLFPALAEIGRQGQWLVLVDPPWVPYPAALQGHGLCLERLLLIRTRSAGESLWACEQALRFGRGGAVLAWPASIDFARLRRLQLAAESHAKLACLFRPAQALQDASPAALRLHLAPANTARLDIRVVKCRGRRPPEPLQLSLPFSSYGKPFSHTAAHDTLLAGHPLSAPGARPVHPRPERPEDADRRQRPH